MRPGEKAFTRQQIYAIRERGDSGESAPSIARDFPHVSLETIRRIIRRSTYREIGSGGAERPLVANRLIGETRKLGSPVATWHPAGDLAAQASRELDEAERRLAGRALPGVPAPSSSATSPAALADSLRRVASLAEPSPAEQALAALLARGQSHRLASVARAPAGFDELPSESGEPDSPGDEPPEAILARKAPPGIRLAREVIDELGKESDNAEE